MHCVFLEGKRGRVYERYWIENYIFINAFNDFSLILVKYIHYQVTKRLFVGFNDLDLPSPGTIIVPHRFISCIYGVIIIIIIGNHQLPSIPADFSCECVSMGGKYQRRKDKSVEAENDRQRYKCSKKEIERKDNRDRTKVREFLFYQAKFLH